MKVPHLSGASVVYTDLCVLHTASRIHEVIGKVETSPKGSALNLCLTKDTKANGSWLSRNTGFGPHNTL
jgi:hypothetical protein